MFESTNDDSIASRSESPKHDNITVAVTICGGSSFILGMNALKSALILSKAHLHFVIMTEQELLRPITQKVL